MRELVATAIEDLCGAFARHGYNPTPIVDLGVLIASADGKVDRAERAMLGEVFQTLLETTLPANVVGHLVAASLEVIDVAGAESRARLVGEILHDCEAGEAGLLVALAIAFASEGLTAAEQTVLERIARAASVPPERLSALTERVRLLAPDPVSVRQVLRGQTPRPPR